MKLYIGLVFVCAVDSRSGSFTAITLLALSQMNGSVSRTLIQEKAKRITGPDCILTRC